MVSSRHKTARPAAATNRRAASQNHRPRFNPTDDQGYSHINIQQRADTEEVPSDPDLEEEVFVLHGSRQEEIEEQLFEKENLATNADVPARPLTFAEATMSTKRGRVGRKNSTKGSDASLSGPMSLESLGTFKYTFKKKKKQTRWSAFDLSVADSAREAGSTSEVGVGAGSSRAVSPNPQSFFSASSSSSPRRSTAINTINSANPLGSGTSQFAEEPELTFGDFGQSRKTPTRKTFEFAANGLEEGGLCRLIEGELGSKDTGATYQTPKPNAFEFTAGVTKGKGKERLIEQSDIDVGAGDTQRTPTQNVFNSAAPVSTSAPVPSNAATHPLLSRIDHHCSSDEAEATSSDFDPMRGRKEAAMASIAEAFGTSKAPKVADDIFESIESDPDLPSESVPDSPITLEPVMSAPQPLAYTTVGSLVNPNTVPQFTAPNRIQREGAGRRPLMTFMPNRPSIPMRHSETSYFSRDLPPTLSIQDSMHYAQQLSPSPVRLYQGQQPPSSHSSRSRMSRQQMSLTEEEMTVLKVVGGPQMMSGNVASSQANHTATSQPYSSVLPSVNKQCPGYMSPPKPLTINPDLTLPTIVPSDHIDDGQRRSNALSGLEKMQTIQRLAKFENPMQELARRRLSALSITNFLGRTVANPTGLSSSSPSTSELISHKLAGSLDRGYQFPPPGLENASMAHANPLLEAYSSAHQAPPSNRSGVPQPLTAGPPGQRQYLTSGTNKMSTQPTESRQAHADYWQSAAVDPANQVYVPNLNPQSQTFSNMLAPNFMMDNQVVAPSHHPRDPVYEGEIVGSKLVDSLPISAVTKYYPRGLPCIMTGEFTPLSSEAKLRMSFQSAEEKAAARRKEVDDWFYGGQREYGKTTTDHINDMAQRENVRRGNEFGPIGPPLKSTIMKTPITQQDINTMTTAEATKPLVDAMFRTLLAYADESTDSESRRHLSGFEKPAEFLIDDSEKGNMSFFGEDWGAPPKRVGGGSRFQPALHRPSTTHWE
ncbi:hypothetical protein D0Z07_3072 [Hyphodiscus hymeniophilus]|uniref:Uncharacterized protein n=1 Tax=Hyphodiscus hymeniophilus TaxID=353542 RepID=A0A9P6VM50_9HELO|nr:hypothetical protein D0Z07_3072 [Hyphodiscus hymeniophilus]